MILSFIKKATNSIAGALIGSVIGFFVGPIAGLVKGFKMATEESLLAFFLVGGFFLGFIYGFFRGFYLGATGGIKGSMNVYHELFVHQEDIDEARQELLNKERAAAREQAKAEEKAEKKRLQDLQKYFQRIYGIKIGKNHTDKIKHCDEIEKSLIVLKKENGNEKSLFSWLPNEMLSYITLKLLNKKLVTKKEYYLIENSIFSQRTIISLQKSITPKQKLPDKKFVQKTQSCPTLSSLSF